MTHGDGGKHKLSTSEKMRCIREKLYVNSGNCKKSIDVLVDHQNQCAYILNAHMEIYEAQIRKAFSSNEND